MSLLRTGGNDWIFFFNRRSDEQVPATTPPEKFWIQPVLPLVPTRIFPNTWSFWAAVVNPIATLGLLTLVSVTHAAFVADVALQPNTIVFLVVTWGEEPMAVALVNPPEPTSEKAPTAALSIPVVMVWPADHPIPV